MGGAPPPQPPHRGAAPPLDPPLFRARHACSRLLVRTSSFCKITCCCCYYYYCYYYYYYYHLLLLPCTLYPYLLLLPLLLLLLLLLFLVSYLFLFLLLLTYSLFLELDVPEILGILGVGYWMRCLVRNHQNRDFGVSYCTKPRNPFDFGGFVPHQFLGNAVFRTTTCSAAAEVKKQHER